VIKDECCDRSDGPLLEKAREGAHPLFYFSVDIGGRVILPLRREVHPPFYAAGRIFSFSTSH
jgi:hypothetical protein